MVLFVIAAPLAAAAVAFAVGSNERRPLALLVGALAHGAGVAVLFAAPAPDPDGAWLALDAMGAVILLTITVLSVAASRLERIVNHAG